MPNQLEWEKAKRKKNQVVGTYLFIELELGHRFITGVFTEVFEQNVPNGLIEYLVEVHLVLLLKILVHHTPHTVTDKTIIGG